MEKGTSRGDTSDRFLKAYIKFIKSVRRIQYHAPRQTTPNQHPFTNGYAYNSAPPTVPIFILRPFTGNMEHESQLVVQRLHKEGDRAVIWVDTTGWLDVPQHGWNTGNEDFEPRKDPDNDDGEDQRTDWQLTTSAHRKVASFLQLHLCLYLALDIAPCPFLRHDTYVGKVYLPQSAMFEMGLEDSKRRKLKQKFSGLV